MAQLVLQPDGSAGVDTHLYAVAPDVNFATEIILRAGYDKFAKEAGGPIRPLLRYGLSGLPAGSTINSTTLTFYPGDGVLPGGSTFNLYRITQEAWTEAGATWNKYDGTNNWTTAGGDYTVTDGDSDTIAGPSEQLVFAALKNLTDDAIANRGSLLHLILIGPETGEVDNYYDAKSSDDATSSTRPKLVIDYTVLPGLVVIDQGDGTGATATISASESGATNVVFVQNFSGDLGAGVWQNAGTRVGDGNIVLGLATGHYFGYVASTSAGVTLVSSVVYFVVTDGLESLHSRCLTAAQARIQSLSLSGLDSDNVVIRKVPVDRNLAGSGGVGLPAIVLSPRRAEMPPDAGTNGLDDVRYDVLVAIFDRDNQEPTLELNLDRHLLWREQIARAFRNQRLIGVSQIINAEVEPAEGLLEDAWKHELMVSALLVRFTSREPRGF